MKADWVAPSEALRTIVDSVTALDSEVVALQNARGRILAAPLISPIDLPRWTNSGMDGYAVHAADIAHASAERPVDLEVTEEVPAGSFPARSLPRGCAARVMTGAPVPAGADSVVRIEHTDGGSEGGRTGVTVRIFNGHDAGRNVRLQGEEISRGAVGLREGTPLNAGALGIAASLGGATLEVHRRPIVGVLASGNELVHIDRYAEVLEGRRIVSSNSYAITAALEDLGCETRYLGIAADSPEKLRAAIEQANGCDALITSGGISVGKHDYIKDVLLEMRTEFRFWRVKMRPGSPFAFGTVGDLGGIPWFGLPGNPVSSAVTFEVFCRPALSRMSGIDAIYRRWIPARLLDPFDPVAGLTQFIRVRLGQESDGTFVATLTGKQVSAHLSSIAMADGLMIIGEADVAPSDAIYRVMPLGSGLFGSGAPF